MELAFYLFLLLHIAGGSIGLISGSINLIRRKGDKKHKSIGRIFLYSMLTAGFTSLILSTIHPNSFLFMVGVFTLYMVGTGSRYIYLKMLGNMQGPKAIDWIISISMLLAGIYLLGIGIKNIAGENMFGIVFIVFGLIGLNFVRIDINNYRGRIKEKNYWLLVHLQRMTGSYIAAFTAFLVVNAHYLPIEFPAIVVWLLPTVILTPLIVRWSNKYRVTLK